MTDTNTPSKNLQQSTLSSLLEKPKTVDDLVNEGLGAKRTMQACVSYLVAHHLAYKHSRGEYGRQFYAGMSGIAGPVGSMVIEPPKIVYKGKERTVAQMIEMIRSNYLPKPFMLILLARAIKSAAAAGDEPGKDAAFTEWSYDTLRNAFRAWEEGLHRVLELVQVLENSDVLWEKDSGLVYRLMGYVESNREELTNGVYIVNREEINKYIDPTRKS